MKEEGLLGRSLALLAGVGSRAGGTALGTGLTAAILPRGPRASGTGGDTGLIQQKGACKSRGEKNRHHVLILGVHTWLQRTDVFTP